jgi:hypothetical protein
LGTSELQTVSDEPATRIFRVVEAIVGGGLHLNPGQLVSERELGEYLGYLTREGGVELAEPSD